MVFRRGFTIVELVVVMTIMGILLTLVVVNLSGGQASARDSERTGDAEAIARGLEARYTNGNPKVTAPSYVAPGSYPGTEEIAHILGGLDATFSPTQITGGYMQTVFPGTTLANYSSPGSSTVNFKVSCSSSCGAATDGSATTIADYVYEPIDKNGNICAQGDCTHFSLFYRTEKDSVLHTLRSKHQ